jgi:hypothetical protein
MPLPDPHRRYGRLDADSEAPRRINGAAEIGKSVPPAHPQAPTVARWRVVASALPSASKRWNLQHSFNALFPRVFAVSASSLRSTISPANTLARIKRRLQAAGRRRDLKATVRKYCEWRSRRPRVAMITTGRSWGAGGGLGPYGHGWSGRRQARHRPFHDRQIDHCRQ